MSIKAHLMRVTTIVDSVNEWLGKVVMWIAIPLTVAVLYQVVMRYVFRQSVIWAYDTAWMLNSALFMLGGAYTLRYNKHVQIDILLRQLPRKGQIVHEVVFYVVVFLPAMIILFLASVDYAQAAWERGIRLSTTSWRFPAAPIRTIVPVTFGLLILQGASELIKSVLRLFDYKPVEIARAEGANHDD